MRRIALYVLLAATLGNTAPNAAAAAPGPNTGAASPPASAPCQEAVVNPVSGFAECVKPRGAPVAPPPRRPDAVRISGAGAAGTDTKH
jgi:hypothetical protein